jgi:hypothetical protein
METETILKKLLKDENYRRQLGEKLAEEFDKLLNEGK